MERCSGIQYSKYQFGFVPNRSTDMATALAHDVMEFCKSAGSAVFLCSLDAEGAYDALPHAVLFDSIKDAVPDICWKVMNHWYQRMCIQVKWNGKLSPSIAVLRGTRQGGLTSPLAFNLFYQTLIDKISKLSCGITIGNKNYNIFCYADDILLASTTATGLQTLIDTAVEHITDRGLRFNPKKTTCMIAGKNPFITPPIWSINDVKLSIDNHIKYLGTELSNTSGNTHTSLRTSAANKALYSLQGAGLKCFGLSPSTSFHVYSMAIRTTLLYGCAAINMNRTNLREIDKTQGKHIKLLLGLPFRSRTGPILQAANICPPSETIQWASLDLLRRCLSSNSVCSDFYYYLLKSAKYGLETKTLLGRAKYYCRNHDIVLVKYLINDIYMKVTKRSQSSAIRCVNNGLVDSIKMLLTNYNNSSRSMLQSLLNVF